MKNILSKRVWTWGSGQKITCFAYRRPAALGPGWKLKNGLI